MKQYCSYVVNFLRFRIPDEGWFLVFGVPNAKYLAFGTPDGSVLGGHEIVKMRLSAGKAAQLLC